MALLQCANHRSVLSASINPRCSRPSPQGGHRRMTMVTKRLVTNMSTEAVTEGAAPAATSKPTLFKKLGGAPAVKAAVDIFYDKMMADPRINYFFDGIDMRAQRAHQTAFLSFALGGTDRYDGNANMTSAHSRLVREYNLRMEHFDIVLEHLGGSLADLNVPQEEIAEAAAVVETLRPAFQKAIDEVDG